MKIVEAGRAKAVVWHAADATDTTKLAAREIQRVVDLATGVRLDITTKPDAAPAIKLVSRADLPHDGFEIRRVGAIVEIGGNDRERPDQPDRWFLASHGTLYGAYEFLERFVEARWLLPGEWGEDVPRRESLQIELDAPLRGAPSFAVRELEYVGQSDPPTPGRPRQAVVDWMRVQRLSSALHPRATGYGHSWDDYLRPSDLDEHPEWKPSSGNAVRNGKVTFVCTTAPGLVEHFAKRLIETIDRNPGREMDSISPTDGGGFCTCERCEKLVVLDPHGRRSHAPAILDFYRRVGEIVLRERPGRRLGGLVYYNYQYPPAAAP
ncbi:MAG TPA: DUF4838 domain-containing protein, partial [Pirellulaceae bacterium]|nr:DUF4838 domain-containing protein [Pirellulaceae bacterium]